MKGLIKSLSIVVCLLFCFSMLRAQEEYQELTWGAVSKEDLRMTIYPGDSTAAAVVLADEGIMNVGPYDIGQRSWLLERHKRVKILQEQAIDEQSNVTLYYYHKDGNEKIIGLKAQAISSEGIRTKLAEEDFYFEVINEDVTKVTFSFANVEVGSVLEYSYDHFSRYILVPNSWEFQTDLPVRSSYFYFSSNVMVSYAVRIQGIDHGTIEEVDGKKRIDIGSTTFTINGKSFWLQHGKALLEEPFMTTIEDYVIKVRFQVVESLNLYTGYVRPVYDTWAETSESLLKDDNLGQNFTGKRNYRKLLSAAKSVISSEQKEVDLIAQICKFVTKEIAWSGRFGIWTRATPDEAFAKHQGSISEIQYAGLALLWAYGIEAQPVLLSTRSNGAMITDFPFVDQFNYVVILAKVDGKSMLLDFTDPLLSPGMIREGALNGQGFMLHKEQPEWINLNLSTVQDELRCQGKITATGELEGTFKSKMKSFSAYRDRQALQGGSAEKIWQIRFPLQTSLSEITVSEQDDVSNPLVVEGKFTVKEAGFSNEDYLYLNPLLYSAFAENPFAREVRSYPVNFSFPFEEKSIYQYELPEGYTIESLPENITLNLPGDKAIFQYSAREREGKFSIIIILRVNDTIYMPEEYPDLRNLFDLAAQKMQEQVVLRRM